MTADPIPDTSPVQSSTIILVLSCSSGHQSQAVEMTAGSGGLDDGERRAKIVHVEDKVVNPMEFLMAGVLFRRLCFQT